MEPIVVVNIISVSYSGSTWLNLMLGAHSQGVSAGELKRVLLTPPAVCALHPDNCPVFAQVDPAAQENLFLQIARHSGKRFIFLNNSRKLMQQQEHPQIERRFIHLIRDGRPTTASYLRKNADHSMWRAARWWVHDIKRNERLISRQAAPSLTLRYEDLQKQTAEHIRRICEFIGMPFESAMLEYWNGDHHHFIGGNVGTLLSLLRKRNDPLADELKTRPTNGSYNWDLNHYEKSDPASFSDDRWRTELSPWQLRLFGLLAGRTNRRYGYPRK